MSAPVTIGVDVRDGEFSVSGPPEAALEIARLAACLRSADKSGEQQRLRLECLKLACEMPIADDIGVAARSSDDVIATATRYFAFVQGDAIAAEQDTRLREIILEEIDANAAMSNSRDHGEYLVEVSRLRAGRAAMQFKRTGARPDA